jgi:phosphoglycolate phosphatase
VGDVTKVKPDPEGLLLAVEKLGVKTEDVLYIGDSYVDAMAAEAAGMKFAGVLTGTTTREEFEKYPRESISETVVEFCRALLEE